MIPVLNTDRCFTSGTCWLVGTLTKEVISSLHASSVFLDRRVLIQLQIKMSFKKSGFTKLRLVVHQGLNRCFAMNRLSAIVWKNILEWCCHIRPISERHNPFNFLLIIRQKTLIRQQNYSFPPSSWFDMLHFESFQQFMPRTKDRISSHAQQTARKITTHSWTFQKINTFMGLEKGIILLPYQCFLSYN